MGLNLSNYPPGHPTGITDGHETVVFECESCYRLITPEDFDALKLRLQLKHNLVPTCPQCGKPVKRAICDQCDKPATHVDVDEAVNAAMAYCSDHRMRGGN